MAQQTAVDWLVEQLIPFKHFDFIIIAVQQAKQMEKEQIEKAWDDGDVNIKLFYCGEQYYKETYGK